MRDASMRHARERVWFFSPAIVTALFFALKLALGTSGLSTVSERVAGAGSQTPTMPVKVRVVAQLHRADREPRPKRVVPETEADLMRLFEQEGTVTFLSGEVEVVATSAPEFAPHEVRIEAPTP